MIATLKISHKNLTVRSAADVAEYVAAVGLSGEITTNLSVCDGKVERGLSITLFDVTSLQVRTVFSWAKLRWALGCAWLEVSGDVAEYAGCILKWSLWVDNPSTEVGVRQDVEVYAGQPSPGAGIVYPQEQPRS